MRYGIVRVFAPSPPRQVFNAIICAHTVQMSHLMLVWARAMKGACNKMVNADTPNFAAVAAQIHRGVSRLFNVQLQPAAGVCAVSRVV
jgi:hypothetical protein